MVHTLPILHTRSKSDVSVYLTNKVSVKCISEDVDTSWRQVLQQDKEMIQSASIKLSIKNSIHLCCTNLKITLGQVWFGYIQ